MNATTTFAKQKLDLSLTEARTDVDVWETASKFMQSVTHTDADMNYGTRLTEIKCGGERFYIALSKGVLSFRHGDATAEVHSMGGALFKTEEKFARALYQSLNGGEGRCYPVDPYNDILKDAFSVLLDVLFEERIFVR